MDQPDKIEQIKISKKLRRIIKLSKKISGDFDTTELTEEQIDEINNRSIPNNWITRKILKKPVKK